MHDTMSKGIEFVQIEKAYISFGNSPDSYPLEGKEEGDNEEYDYSVTHTTDAGTGETNLTIDLSNLNLRQNFGNENTPLYLDPADRIVVI